MSVEISCNVHVYNNVCMYVWMYIVHNNIHVHKQWNISLSGHGQVEDTSINRTLSSVPNAIFVYLTTSEMRTPLYSGHFHLSQMPYLCT